MESVMPKIGDFIEMVAQLFFAISILATVIVRLTPTKTDDEFVGSAAEKMLKLLSYLPTIGINPRTKKLEEAYKELAAKEDQKVLQ